MPRTLLLSLGGNAILPGRGAGTIEEQVRVTDSTMNQVAELLADGHRVVITHGNGPIVGNILLRNEIARDWVPPMPLDVCGADSQGGIGYMIQQSLQNACRRRGLRTQVASLVTQVVVDAADPAFDQPSKPIGPFYTPEVAKRQAVLHGWRLVEDSGRGMRRVVPSPKPKRIVELELIRSLFEDGYVIVAAGGGGIPVVERDGRLSGVEAVVDKDRTSVLLARALGVETLINVTSIDQVALDYGLSTQRLLASMSLAEAKAYLAAGQFPEGSMGPKIGAAIDFLEAGGAEVVITSAARLAPALRGQAGTRIALDPARVFPGRRDLDSALS